MAANPQPGSRAWWETKLDEIIKVGAYPPALMEVPGLFDAPQIRKQARSDSSEDLARAAVEVLLRAVLMLGDRTYNPIVRAALKHLGLDPTTRGLPLKDRRCAAADEIRVRGADGERAIAVSTWRRNYEPQVRRDLAWALARPA